MNTIGILLYLIKNGEKPSAKIPLILIFFVQHNTYFFIVVITFSVQICFYYGRTYNCDRLLCTYASNACLE